MIQGHLALRVASLAGLGYIRGSGTLASLCVIPYIYSMNFYDVSLYIQLAVITVFSCLSFLIIRAALQGCARRDPSEIILDECVGMMIAAYALPFSWFGLLLTFFLFRLLDISKFFGISFFERLPGAWGVVLDDVAAACVANIIMRFIVPLACA